MINEMQYNQLKNKYEVYESARKALCGKRNYTTPEDAAKLPEGCTNDEISAMEVYEFVTNPPEKYFLYVDQKNRKVMTWTGDILGDCSFGYRYHSNMGDKRIPITVNAINGKKYSGIFYESAGDYARVKVCKG